MIPNNKKVNTEQETQNNNISNKQDKLTAGDNITINNNVISSKNTTYNVATTSSNGLMSSSDKTKLDSLSNYDDTSIKSRLNLVENATTQLTGITVFVDSNGKIISPDSKIVFSENVSECNYIVIEYGDYDNHVNSLRMSPLGEPSYGTLFGGYCDSSVWESGNLKFYVVKLTAEYLIGVNGVQLDFSTSNMHAKSISNAEFKIYRVVMYNW